MFSTKQKVIVAVVIGAISIALALFVTRPRINTFGDINQSGVSFEITPSPEEIIATETPVQSSDLVEIDAITTTVVSPSDTGTPVVASEDVSPNPIQTSTPTAEGVISENTNIQDDSVDSKDTSTSQENQELPQSRSAPVIIDHRAVDKFENIPDEYIQAASNIKFLFRHASVGKNINDGLDCMRNNFNKRPHRCDREVPPNEIVFDEKYDNSNWQFEFHNPPPGQNPGWWNKVNFFIDRIENLESNEADVVSFKFGYVDGVPGSDINDKFFGDGSGGEFPTIHNLEILEIQHPDKTFVLWTMGLARSIGSAESDKFNAQMRDYAVTNGKILMDIADIQSHRPDGSPCTDNNGQGHEALCQEYTQEVNGGHLNARGQQRMAQAVWVLMATLAGWDGAIISR